MNDAVAVILTKTMERYLENPVEIESETILKTVGYVAYDFLKLFLLSLVIGIFFGFALSYLTKKFRFIA